MTPEDKAILSRYAVQTGLVALSTEALRSNSVPALEELKKRTALAQAELETLLEEATPQAEAAWAQVTSALEDFFQDAEDIAGKVGEETQDFVEPWAQWFATEVGPVAQYLWDQTPIAKISQYVNRDPKKPWTRKEWLGMFGPAGQLANIGTDLGNEAVQDIATGLESVGVILGNWGKNLLWLAGGVLGLGAVVALGWVGFTSRKKRLEQRDRASLRDDAIEVEAEEV